MTYIDTHAHLYAEEFNLDRDEVLERAINAGVNKILLPNIDKESIVGLLSLINNYPDNCFAMKGLHPCSVNENYKKDLSTIEQLMLEMPIKAIGEIGMDLYWDTTYQKEQEHAFIIQCGWANDLNLPVAIHTRNATKETIACLNQLEKQPSGVFHCFGGTIQEAKEIIDLGYLLGIGGVLTYKNSTLATVLKEIDIKHLVLETDAPYLSPVPYRGKRNESSYIPIIASKLAEIYNMPIDLVAKQTSDNACRLFNL